MSQLRALAEEESRREAAADWAVRLRMDDLSEAQATEFGAWLDQDPANGAAFDRVLTVTEELERNAAAVQGRLAQRRAPSRRSLWWSAGATAAAAALALLMLPQLGGPETQTIATGVGEHRTVTLDDGSVVNLNGSTRLSVTLSRSARLVSLEGGEAIFDVAHDTRRPFEVTAGDRVVRVVGTQFDVKRRGDSFAVTVARGMVEVRPAGASGRSYRLHPGQRLEHRQGQEQSRVAAANPAEVMGWRARRLVYRGAALSEVVADLNEQFPTQMRIADADLASVPVSGVLILDDQQAVIRRLALLAPIEAVRSGESLVLRREGAPQR